MKTPVTVAALILACGAALSLPRVTGAQGPGLSIIPEAVGFSPDHRIRFDAKGPNNVFVLRIIAEPGADTGWHTHPGPAVLVVKSGEVTEYHENGCVTVHPTGSVIVEEAGEVHKVVNEGAATSESQGMIVAPAGAPPLVPADAPPTRECNGQD